MAEVALAHRQPLGRQRRHRRGDDRGADVGQADPAQLEQVAQRRADLVGGRLGDRREAPVLDAARRRGTCRSASACCRRRRRGAWRDCSGSSAADGRHAQALRRPLVASLARPSRRRSRSRAIPYKTVELLIPTQRRCMRLRFGAGTVPGLKLDGGEKVSQLARDHAQARRARGRPAAAAAETPTRARRCSRPSAGATRCCSRWRGGSCGSRCKRRPGAIPTLPGGLAAAAAAAARRAARRARRDRDRAAHAPTPTTTPCAPTCARCPATSTASTAGSPTACSARTPTAQRGRPADRRLAAAALDDRRRAAAARRPPPRGARRRAVRRLPRRRPGRRVPAGLARRGRLTAGVQRPRALRELDRRRPHVGGLRQRRVELDARGGRLAGARAAQVDAVAVDAGADGRDGAARAGQLAGDRQQARRRGSC